MLNCIAVNLSDLQRQNLKNVQPNIGFFHLVKCNTGMLHTLKRLISSRYEVRIFLWLRLYAQHKNNSNQQYRI